MRFPKSQVIVGVIGRYRQILTIQRLQISSKGSCSPMVFCDSLLGCSMAAFESKTTNSLSIAIKKSESFQKKSDFLENISESSKKISEIFFDLSERTEEKL